MNATSLSEIQAKIAELEAQADKLRHEAAVERQKVAAGVIQEIRSKIAEYGLTAKDLGLSNGGNLPFGKIKRKTSASAAGGTLYRNADGATWTSATRGPKPRWLREALAAGKQLSDFEVT